MLGIDRKRAGLGLGCNGTVDVLLETLRGGGPQMEFLSGCLRERRDGVLAKVFAAAGEIAAQPGNCLWLAEGVAARGTVAEAQLHAAVLADARSGIDVAPLVKAATGEVVLAAGERVTARL